MGVINITVQGSFRKPTTRQFSAMHGGARSVRGMESGARPGREFRNEM